MITSENTVLDLQEKKIDYKDLYIRTLADYQNLQRRSLEEKRAIAKRASYDMLLKILPLYHDAKQGFFYKEKGATLLYKKFVKFLTDNNIRVIDLNFFKEKTNEKFSEEYAVAIGVKHPEEDDLFPETLPDLDNMIASVVEDGFIDNETGKVISFAKVIVYKLS